jgi:hypothetical protein
MITRKSRFQMIVLLSWAMPVPLEFLVAMAGRWEESHPVAFDLVVSSADNRKLRPGQVEYQLSNAGEHMKRKSMMSTTHHLSQAVLN